MTDNSTWNYDQKINSDTKTGCQVIQDFITQLEMMGWPDKDLFGIHLALEEAIMNAIKHGNQFAGDKRVHIVAEFSETDFFARVTDEGNGFDPDDVPDPTLDENLEIGSGRGLMLMYHYMDEVIYNDEGNSIVIRKRRQSDN